MTSLPDASAPPPSPSNLAEAIAFYAAHDLPVTPVRPGAKQGYRKGWSLSGHAAGPADFRVNDNIGVLNGTEPSVKKEAFFHDVDIDANSDAARSIVERLLPATGWIYGRASKPRSHRNYLTTAQLRTRKYVDHNGKTIIELRGITQKKTHTLSVGPGSTHESGEPIRFCQPHGPIGQVADSELLDTAVQHAAVGIVILQVWPDSNRHSLRLAFAKVLAEHDVAEQRIAAILEAVMQATGSDVEDVRATVHDTAAKMQAGEPTAGASTVLTILGDDIGRRVLVAIARILRSRIVDDGDSIVINEATPSMVDRAWAKVIEANEPPGLFRQDENVLILRHSANTCLGKIYEEQLKLTEPASLQNASGFRRIEVDTFREIVARMVPCVQSSARGEQKKHVYPPREFANLMLATPVLPLPEACGFTSIPFFTKDGCLVTTPGLHRDSGMFYQPSAGFTLPDVPDTPTDSDVASALDLLDAMMWQFPFSGRLGAHPYTEFRAHPGSWRDTAAFANTLAFPLTILTRSLFPAVPLFLFDKPTTRTGASLLVQCWCYVLTGSWPDETEWGASKEERRKFLTAILMTGAPIIFLDEVEDLNSGDLNKILTGKGGRTARVLGTSEITRPKNLSTFAATGNNPRYPKDMAGRMCRVRLDAAMLRPSHRSGWDKDLMTWVPANRTALLRALYVLVRAWFAAGRPAADVEHVLNGFESWSTTIGGILAHAGLTKFLANKSDVEDDAEDMDAPDETEAFIVSWADSYPNQVTTTGLLIGFPLPMVNGVPWGMRQLGNWLRVNRDRRRRLSDGREVLIEREKGEGQWRLRVLTVATGQPRMPWDRPAAQVVDAM